MKNRFKVELHGNAPVVFDTLEHKCVKWFGDVLYVLGSRKDAETFAAELNAAWSAKEAV